MDAERKARNTVVRVIRKAVRFWLKHWPQHRCRLESVLTSLLAEVADCRETDLIDAVNESRPASYWLNDT
jgi:hypothetical protein